jgi:endonuclease/exonuclease/phosphatase family metal-dependent hydrolase
MPFLLIAFALIAMALSAFGSLSAGRPSRSMPHPPGAFTVMTFNIQHGITASGRYDLGRAAAVIAKLQPDFVGLQETTRNHPSYNCDDQPKKLAESLQTMTGREWHRVYEQEWFTPDTSCRDRGAGDGKETEGLTILSPHPLEQVSHTTLWNTRIGLVARTAQTGRIPIVVTHWANGDRNRNDRVRQMGQLISFAEELGTPRILIGDLNMHPDSDEYPSLLRHYRDAWVEAGKIGGQRGVASGSTRVGKIGRIDYILYTSTPSLVLDWVEVVDTKDLVGKAASDHQPVLAQFHVNE